MAFVSNEQYKEVTNLRDMIEGELNRIAVTDDHSEIDKMLEYLQDNINRYAKKHHDRINSVYNPDEIHTVDIEL